MGNLDLLNNAFNLAAGIFWMASAKLILEKDGQPISQFIKGWTWWGKKKGWSGDQFGAWAAICASLAAFFQAAKWVAFG